MPPPSKLAAWGAARVCKDLCSALDRPGALQRRGPGEQAILLLDARGGKGAFSAIELEAFAISCYPSANSDDGGEGVRLIREEIGERMQILIVEDDTSIRDMLSECLADEGYTTVAVSDGQQGLDLLRASPALPGLILLDLAMPVMSGWEFLEIQQGDPRLAPIPLIVLSADSSVVKRSALGPGVRVLAKPVDINTLIDTVAGYLL